MGDAAFLLLAREPLTALAVFAVSVVAGIVTGWLVERIHGRDFMRVSSSRTPKTAPVAGISSHRRSDRALLGLWWLWLIPGFIFGILEAFQIDADMLLANAVIDRPVTLFGAVGALLSLILWLRRRNASPTDSDLPSLVGETVVKDTSFVTTWVVLAYLLFELGVFATGIDLSRVFYAWTPLLPLLAILIGLLPGCGPQLVITSLYLAGAVPLSAQLGNAIANDGDALFPAMALAPRAALLATLYSALPALVVAYGYYWILE